MLVKQGSEETGPSSVWTDRSGHSFSVHLPHSSSDHGQWLPAMLAAHGASGESTRAAFVTELAKRCYALHSHEHKIHEVGL